MKEFCGFEGEEIVVIITLRLKMFVLYRG